VRSIIQQIVERLATLELTQSEAEWLVKAVYSRVCPEKPKHAPEPHPFSHQ
jgi:hypothetical protein